MALMELFGPKEPINSLEELLGDFGDFDFRPESNFLSSPKYTIFKFFENSVGGKFFENFSWVFPRSTHQDASIELLFVKFGSVGASEKTLHSK